MPLAETKSECITDSNVRATHIYISTLSTMACSQNGTDQRNAEFSIKDEKGKESIVAFRVCPSRKVKYSSTLVPEQL